MHHRRRSRRRDKRHMLSCGCCESFNRDTDHPDIDDNEICNGRPKRKKPRPKKDKCPVNGTHEWYKEPFVEDCSFSYSFTHDYKLVRWSEEGILSTCIHCWRTKFKRQRTVWDNTYRNRKRTPPKRPVKF